MIVKSLWKLTMTFVETYKFFYSSRKQKISSKSSIFCYFYDLLARKSGEKDQNRCDFKDHVSLLRAVKIFLMPLQRHYKFLNSSLRSSVQAETSSIISWHTEQIIFAKTRARVDFLLFSIFLASFQLLGAQKCMKKRDFCEKKCDASECRKNFSNATTMS